MVSAPTMARPARSVAVIGGLVLLLVVAAVIATLTLDSLEPASFPADSPEAAFQRYYRAFQDGDTQTAYDAFSERIRAQMSYDQFTWYATQYRQPSEQSTIVRIDRSERTGERVELHLTIERISGSGINVSRYSEQRRVRLIQEDGVWKIDEALIGIDPGYFGPPPATPTS